jgi:hypothetical protein
MTSFTLVLENQQVKIYQRISWLIVAVNFFAFLSLAYTGVGSNGWFVSLPAALVLALYTVTAFLKLKKDITHRSRFFMPFLASAVAWLLLQQYAMMLVVLVMLVLEKKQKQTLDLIIDEEKITYPSFPMKIFTWSEITNVILKDDLLTIDLCNNKLIQVFIKETGAAENTINEFCRAQLSQTVLQPTT